MKKILLFLTVLAIVFIYIDRERLFLRDPLAKMSVDGVQVEGAQVFINYPNDVLVLRSDAEPMIVQNWDKTPGTIQVLPCLRAMACLSGADHAAKFPLHAGAASMTNREITFRDAAGKTERITLR